MLIKTFRSLSPLVHECYRNAAGMSHPLFFSPAVSLVLSLAHSLFRSLSPLLIHTLSLTSSCDPAGGKQTERLVFNL